MNIEQKVFDDLLNVMLSLVPDKAKEKQSPSQLQEGVGKDIVIGSIPDEQLLPILKKYKLKLPSYSVEILKEPAILIETIKIIALMETVDSWADFTKLNEKRISKRDKKKPKEKEFTDFDKLLKGITKVPKKETK